MDPQIDALSFTIKIIVLLANVLVFGIYMFIRMIINGRRFIFSGEHDEEKLLRSKGVTVKELQEITWTSNVQKTISFGPIGISTLILAVVFIFEYRLQGFDALFFNLILMVAGISILFYFVSLQLWFMALDFAPSDFTKVMYRQKATVFQNLGWLCLILTVLLSILLINTVLGFISCLIAVICIIYVFEFKAKVSIEDEHNSAGLNEFQQSLDLHNIYKKNEDVDLLDSGNPKYVKVMSWNIERGYNPDEIVESINSLNPDIVCLQEVDWNNERTGNLDILQIIAEKTTMLGLFSIEFFEIESPFRSPKTRGGGVHGNAILTRIKPKNYYRIELPILYDWATSPDKVAKKEKRQGARFALCAEFDFGSKDLIVVSTHLENNKSGIQGRFQHFSIIVNKIFTRKSKETPTIICGDFNTIESWITSLARLDNFAGSMGKKWYQNESQYWKTTLLKKFGFVDPFRISDWTFKFTNLYKQKLDWILVRNCKILDSGIGPLITPDHKAIWADINLEKNKG